MRENKPSEDKHKQTMHIKELSLRLEM
jgi:hypothetical protein